MLPFLVRNPERVPLQRAVMEFKKAFPSRRISGFGNVSHASYLTLATTPSVRRSP